ncbi:hypothetical protein S245_020814 [Arachis hypogaea]
MLSIATLKPSTSFNHSLDYNVHRIINRSSLLPSIFSLSSNSNPFCSSSIYRPLHIAIVGFGNFGLAAILVRQSHTVLVHSCPDDSATAKKLGVSFVQNPDDLCVEHPEVIFLCSSLI